MNRGPAKKVTIYVNEDTQHHMVALHDSIMNLLLRKGVSGATATRAYAGFGSHQRLHHPHVEALAEHLPIRIEFVDSPAKVEELLPSLYEIVSDGLIEVQDTIIVKQTHEQAKPEAAPPPRRWSGTGKILHVFLGEADKWHGEPLCEAIVKKLRLMEVAGVTVQHEHRASFFHPVRDLPVVVTVVDAEDKIRAAAAAIEAMLQNGLLVINDAELVRLQRGD